MRSNHSQTLLARYGGAVLVTALAAAVRGLLDPVLGERAPYGTFFVAAVLAAWFGGWGPSLVSALLGAAAADYWFITPRHALFVSSPAELIGIGSYALCWLVTALAVGSVRVARRRADERARFLTDAGTLLASSLEPATILETLARLAVPRLADWCAIHVRDDDGAIRQAALAHPDPAKLALAKRLEARYPPEESISRGAAQVIRTGQAQAARVSDAALRAATRDPEHLAVLRGLGLRSYIIVPLVARGRTFGALTLVTAESRRRYGAADLALAEDLARRAALAVDNARLYQAAQAEIAERTRAQQALKDADRRKDEFLAMLGHELRNPLAPIRNAVQVLLFDRADDALVAEMGAMIERQVAHMVRLVEDLLDVSRITRGKIELRPERLDLREPAGRAVDTVRPLVEDRRHRLEVSLPAEPLWLDADPARLEQVIANLLTNSAKYTEPGGTIWLEARRDGAEAVVTVRDTGIGVAPTMLPRLFDLFQQAGHPSGRVPEGLGIGLTLVKSLVELHGGRVSAESPGVGKGSTFMVRVPLASAAPTPASPNGHGGPAAASGLRILAVDDNADAVASLARLLRLQGHETRVAYTGEEAVAVARDFRPDVTLLDIGLPGIDGYEVARRLRREPGLEHSLVVAVTGYGQEGDRRRALEAGFDLHVVKPVDPAVLREVLTQVPR